MSTGHWLRRPVLVGISALLVAMYAIAWVQRTVGLWRNGWIDANHMPFGGDFVTFWAGSRVALEGNALSAFDPPAFFAVQEAAIAGNQAHFLWNYPPTFHLFVLPFGLVDLVTATWLWWAVTVPLYLAALVRVVPRWETAVVGLAGSAVLLNLAHGQNGFLLTALLVGGLWLVLHDRPVLGGLVLGCLSIKPHFGVLLPVALAASRNPRAFAATAASLLVWCGVSTAVFGLAYWSVFADNLGVVGQAIDHGDLPLGKIVTPYVLARSVGLGALAGPIQLVSIAVSAACVAYASSRGRPAGAMAVLIVATTLCSPYLFDYDLILLCGAFAFAYVDRTEHGWVPGERELWGLAALLPIGLVALYNATGLQLGPLLTGALLAVCTWGAVRTAETP
ncbi:MAG: glycosyltransferase family 87 protein [Myxococcota bacterium]